VARHRRRSTEWQLDLRPVLPTDHVAGRNGSSPDPHPGQADGAVLHALNEIQLAVDGLRQAVDQLSGRLDGIEQRLAAQPAVREVTPTARRPRQVRDPGEVRDSATVSLERHARRTRSAGPRPVQDDAAEQ
jgi:hypothetical protein